MSQQQPPQAPSFGQSYGQGISIYDRWLPVLLRQEEQYRNLYDPQRIQEQQGLQAQFGPTQYAQQLQALSQLDPTGTALRTSLGNQIAGMLGQGYVDPLQARAYNMLGQSVTGQLARGT